MSRESQGVLTPKLLSEIAKDAQLLLGKLFPRNSGVTAGDLVDTAVVKFMNANQALALGHAEVRNGRIRLTEEAARTPELAQQYSQGLRRWDGARPLRVFFKLAVLSEARARLRPSSPRVHLLPGVEERSPEDDTALQFAKRALLDAIQEPELLGIAEAILFCEASMTDLMCEFELTRSQLEKRINKIHQIAELAFSTKGKRK